MLAARCAARQVRVAAWRRPWNDGSVTEALQHLIRAMHASPTMLVYEFAGAGSQALAWLHAVGGSSRTVLEAVDRYAAGSLEEAVTDPDGAGRAASGDGASGDGASGGGPPRRWSSVNATAAQLVSPDMASAQAVSPEVAAALAHRAALRARALAPEGVAVIGVGCTATIATDRRKRGEHRAFVAVEGALGRHSSALTLRKGERDRDAEERLVSTLVVHAAASGCGVLHRRRLALREGEALEETFEPAAPLAELLAGRREHVALTPAGELRTGLPWPSGGIAIVPGSFNPLHEGHLGLAAAAQAHVGRPVAFELAPRNAEKPTLEHLELYRRATQFQGHAPLLMTGVALFSHKAALYPGSVFVLGVDTAARVLMPRYYPSEHDRDTALSLVRKHGSRFLVAGRRLPGEAGGARVGPGRPTKEAAMRFVTLADLDVPQAHADLFEALPEGAFRADVSSSLIRERWDRSGVDA